QRPRQHGGERVGSTDEVSHHPGPAGLVSRPQTGAVVPVEVLVEGDVVAPPRVALQLVDPAVAGTAAVRPAEEQRDQATSEVLGAHPEGHRPTAPGWVLDL